MSFYNFGGRTRTPTPYFDPFQAQSWWNMSPLAQDYYTNNPSAVAGYFNQQARQSPYSQQWKAFSERWMGDLLNEYQGAVGQPGNEELQFWQYASQQAPRLGQEYALNQSMQRAPVRPTRWLRRY